MSNVLDLLRSRQCTCRMCRAVRESPDFLKRRLQEIRDLDHNWWYSK